MENSKQRPATLRDIAETVDMSMSTVSRVLTGSHPVAPERAEVVREAARRLGYRPNGAARSLRHSRTMSLGVVLHRAQDPTLLRIVGGLESAVQKNGYNVFVSQAHEGVQQYNHLLQRCFEMRVDGLFLSAPQQIDRGVLRAFREASVPTLALVAKDHTAEELAVLVMDEASAIDAACRRIVELGHLHIAQFASKTESEMGSRVRLVRESLASYSSHAIHSIGIVDQAAGSQAVSEQVRVWLTQPNPPTVILARETYLAAIIGVLHGLQLQIPDDVSLIAFEDSSWTQAYVPEISVINSDFVQFGRLAGSMMMACLKDGTPIPSSTAAPAEWIERASLGRRPVSLRASGPLS